MRAMPTRGDRGATSTEYALLAAAVAAMIVVTLFALGQHVYRVHGSSCDQISTTAARPSDC